MGVEADSITATPVLARDLADLASVHAAAFGVHAWPAAMLAESLAQPYVYGLQLRSGDGLVGFALIQRVADDDEILTYAVAPGLQRRGYGRQLLQEIYDAAKAAKRQRIFLEVAEDNIPAIRLYAGFGFHVTGKRPGYYPRPTGAVAAILMQFDL